MKKLANYQQLLSSSLLATAVLLMGHYARPNLFRATRGWLVVLAIVLVVAVELKGEFKKPLDELVYPLSRLSAGIAAVLLITLSPSAVTAFILAVLYVGLRLSLLKQGQSKQSELLLAAAGQFTAMWAIFLAAGIWSLSGYVVMALAWASSFIAASRLLVQYEERARWLLAGAWALAAAELSYVFSLWLVNYILPGGHLIIPQAALVLTALGYIFGGIFISHKLSQLSRARLAEYLVIGLFLIIIVITGTKWSGSV